MKNIIQTLMLAMLMVLASPMVAAQNESSADEPMVQQMQKMHSHMQAMQQQMKEIKVTKDPDQRKALLQQHMQSMREGMAMMGEMDNAHGKMMMGEMDNAHGKMMMGEMGDAKCEQMQTMGHSQEGMQERMQMMQMMLQQMMDHESVQADQQ